jgi:hypothetical protein
MLRRNQLILPEAGAAFSRPGQVASVSYAIVTCTLRATFVAWHDYGQRDQE